MSVDKYLRVHADTDSRFAGHLDGGPWAASVVIPARLESSADLVRAASKVDVDGRLLVIVVLNHDEAVPQEVACDRACRAGLLALGEASEVSPGVVLVGAAELDYLVVGRPAKGVGAARRLGSDIALQLWAAGKLESDWVHGTDADARLPAEHHRRVAQSREDVAASVAPFHHVSGGDGTVDGATWAYERSLRYYRLGLLYAGSPWAFHTIGSLISFRARAYAQVRGYPRREAGEDFYLLAKLAKVGMVTSLEGAPVSIRARRSTRVPFGTGPAVERELVAAQPAYDPRCFRALARWHQALDAPNGPLLETLEGPLLTVAESLGLLDGVRKVVARYPPVQHRTRLREVFDAFKTLKLVHGLTEHWPKVSWTDVVSGADFVPNDLAGPVSWVQLRKLEALEAKLSRQAAR